MLDRLRSPGAGRAFVWISSLVLIAGVIAFATVRLGGDDGGASAQGTTTALSEEEIDAAIDGTTTTTPTPVSKVPKAARTAAGDFILAAAGREDLPKAWRLSHPTLREQCGCTYKQWLTGNIPIQPFPTSGLQGVSYFVDELAPRRVVLQVLLRPAAGSDLGDQAFHIGLQAVGNGKSQAWLVDLWSPISPVPIPQG
jgi:hypothetical protein